MTGYPICVLCVDDNEYIREALYRRLARFPEFRLVGSLPCADDLVSEAVRTGAQIVLLDMNMPGKDPIEAARELAATAPSVRIIALSGYLDAPMVDRALEAGLCGYLSKSEEPAALVSALRRAAAGEMVLSPEVARGYVWWAAATDVSDVGRAAV
jgi:DNA-binding NarL/FixJ family response regulator